MPKIEKTQQFLRMEERYLKKLNPKQKDIYLFNLEQFENSKSREFFDKIKTHALQGDLK
jgi:hypothetical protein